MNYKRDQKFIHPENWGDIRRGWIHEAAIPYTAERPLNFFIENEDDPTTGRIIGGFGEFKPQVIHKAVIELKQRKVLILSNDDLCADKTVFDVTVSPIYGIYPEDKNEEWCKKVLNNTHPFFAYLPEEVTGRECLVDLSNIITISKSMLLKDKIDINGRLDHIEKLIHECLSLGMYNKAKIKDGDVG